MCQPLRFVYACHLNAARLQNEQGILPRELMSCVAQVRAAFNPYEHGFSGHFVCFSCKHRELAISFVRVDEQVVITGAKLISIGDGQLSLLFPSDWHLLVGYRKVA